MNLLHNIVFPDLESLSLFLTLSHSFRLQIINHHLPCYFYRVLFILSTIGLVNLGSLAKTNQPNFVIIFTDDMGYGDIGPFGSDHPTPHLNRMAEEGMKLTDFYVSSTACTPSRSALLTGCYADRIEMGRSVVFPADKRGLNPKEITIAEMLKEGGYKTGCFGKWHLGDQLPFMPGSRL